MNYLVDTNILLRLADRNHPQHPIIRQAIRILRIIYILHHKTVPNFGTSLLVLVIKTALV